MKLFSLIGQYAILMGQVFHIPEKWSIFRKKVFEEMVSLGIGSMGIVSIISLFMGAVIAIQTASNTDSPFVPLYSIGFITRQSVILEFSPTILALILAGKIGSNIASEIGTMRVTEQIDALEIMGINPAAFLILPKIVAAVLINPILTMYSMFLAISGGWWVVVTLGIVSNHEFQYGVQYEFKPYHLTYALIKTVFFAFAFTSVPAFYGYKTRGGALEVGKSSTQAVVISSIVVLLLNYILTQILLI